MKTYILGTIVLFLALSCGYFEYKVQKLKAEKSSLEYELALLEEQNVSLQVQLRASNKLITDNNASFDNFIKIEKQIKQVINSAKFVEIKLGVDDETRKQVCEILNSFD